MDSCDYSWAEDIYGHALLNVWKLFQEKLGIKNNKKEKLVWFPVEDKKYKTQINDHFFFSIPIPVYNPSHPWKQSKPFLPIF